MPTPHYHIAIIGLGPVGLLAAHAMAQRGWRVLAIEQHETRLPYPRAIALDSETLRFLQSLGLLDLLLPLMRPSDGLQFINSQEESLLHIRIKSANGYKESWMVYQPELEALLERRLQYPNLDLWKSYQLEKFHQNDTTIELQCQHHKNTSQQNTATAQYLIACDGANSTTRQLLNIKLKKSHYSGYNLKVDVQALPSYPIELHPAVVQKHCSHHFPWVRMKGRGQHLRWEFPMKKPTENTNIEALAQQLLKQAGAPIEQLQPLHTSLYQYHAARASQWQEKRIFLAGDAAHRTPPYIGQGLCAGIRDIANLHWKLHEALKKPEKTSQKLFASYQSEREPHFLFALRIAIAVGYLFKTPLYHLLRPWRHIPWLRGFLQNLHVLPPKIGKGYWGKGSGKRQLLPQTQFYLKDGTQVYSDDFLGKDWVIIGLVSIPSKLMEQCKQRGLPYQYISPELDRAQQLIGWLQKRRATYAIIRPDKQVYSTGKRLAVLLKDWEARN